MKKNQQSAFTLVEMLTVIAIIAVIASLVAGVSGLVNRKGATARAEGEIHAFTAASESYKVDNGVYPRNGDTDDLDPRKDTTPTANKYLKANIYFYSQLSGDVEPEGNPDGKVDADAKVYFPFKQEQLGGDKDASTGKLKKVKYIQDPFGQPYGYSTAAAKLEAEYRDQLRDNPNAKREGGSGGGSSSKLKGYNSALFDLWSTGGTTSKASSSGSTGEADQSRWVKNW